MRYALALLLIGCASTEVTTSTSTIREVPSSCEPLDWPVTAAISSGFGARDARPHTGIDLPVPEGTNVLAACDGVVTYASSRGAYGRLVVLDHGGGRSTFYAHNVELLVAPGEHVARGQVIARSGQTGNASGPHVHFELREHDRAIDPVPHLRTALRVVSR